MNNWRREIVRVVLLLAATTSGCGGPAEQAVRPEQVTDFKTLYRTNCAGCHGVDGRRGAAQPLNDPVYLALVSDGGLTEVISRGVRGTPMTAFAVDAGGTLTNAQVRALVDGLRRSWGGTQPAGAGPPPPYSEGEAGDSARGRTTFETHCARCHGLDGGGGPTAGSVVNPSFLSLTSDQSLRTTIIVGRNDESIPGWREYVPGQPMTNQQVSDVVAWLVSHRGNHD
jgi:cytochrome c oxidase cbb3-type subunit III